MNKIPNTFLTYVADVLYKDSMVSCQSLILNFLVQK
jgi:hypothetical protein